ncbi:MAG: tRNA glutamyl-Q(34) synthetase GluQRS [Rhodomicrobium sp.]
MSRPVFRFAPSPNGRLHLGHAFSALCTARAADAASGVFLLRIEDIDPLRSKPEFEAGILEDLSWLGLHWEEPVLRQSSRMGAYAAVSETLRDRDLIYPCFCSRRSAAAVAIAQDPDGAPIYTATCRCLSKDEAAERIGQGEQAQWRLKMDLAIQKAGPLTMREAAASGTEALWADETERQADPARWGDAVLLRKEVPTSYHLSVTADDAVQGVTHVTRGMDLFHATDLHVLLQRLLGLPPPVYCHHRLLRDPDGQKLSKSRQSRSLKSLREGGWTAADVRKALGFP